MHTGESIVASRQIVSPIDFASVGFLIDFAFKLRREALIVSKKSNREHAIFRAGFSGHKVVARTGIPGGKG